ncbi:MULTISPECIES: SDR family NAD(P)-dependent oxidoreductase [unclassified Streptomyces]|uniref:SDR family NAD(P)-dependent oxidoreductase n=1 Tax=unclassified Streptomyces TaxID=2593676 RepID=UPI00340883FD
MRDTVKAIPKFADLNDVPFARLDVTDAASIERAVKESIERFGAVDVVVNAAGQGRLGVIEEASADQVRDQFETDVRGQVEPRWSRTSSRRCGKRGCGHIINIGSMGGHVSLPAMAGYCSSKSAVQNLTAELAEELGPLDIHVTMVEPAGSPNLSRRCGAWFRTCAEAGAVKRDVGKAGSTRRCGTGYQAVARALAVRTARLGPGRESAMSRCPFHPRHGARRPSGQEERNFCGPLECRRIRSSSQPSWAARVIPRPRLEARSPVGAEHARRFSRSATVATRPRSPAARIATR